MSRLYSQTACRPESAAATPRYTDEQIAEANARHDAKYGYVYGNAYSNLSRLPETTTKRPEELWKT